MVVSEYAEQNMGDPEDCHTKASMDNLDLEIRTTSTLERISEIDDQLCATSDLRPYVVESQCPLVSRNNENILEAKTKLDANNEDESSLDKGHSDTVVMQRVDSLGDLHKCLESPQKFDTKESCRKSDFLSSSPGMSVVCDYEKLPKNVNLEKGNKKNMLTSGFSTSVTNEDIKNLRTVANIVGNTAKDIQHLSSVRGITIKSLESDTDQYGGRRYDNEIPNEERRAVVRVAEDVNTEEINSKVLPLHKNNSPPMILMDVNSISCISMKTTEDNSQTVSTNSASTTSENTFVFGHTDVNLTTLKGNTEDSVDIIAEIKIRSEQQGNVKRKKKPLVWQDLQNKKKKTSISTRASAVQFVRIEPKPSVEISELSKKIKLGNVKQNR